MNDARLSIALKFETPEANAIMTIRSDGTPAELLAEAEHTMALLTSGTFPSLTPTVQPEPQVITTDTQPPTCASCQQTDRMQLIEFFRRGKPKRAWKCQRCGKWHHPDEVPE